jgi:hypothetical protein
MGKSTISMGHVQYLLVSLPEATCCGWMVVNCGDSRVARFWKTSLPWISQLASRFPEQSTMWDRNKRWFMFSHLSTGKPNKDHLAIKICLVVVGAVKTIKAAPFWYNAVTPPSHHVYVYINPSDYLDIHHKAIGL